MKIEFDRRIDGLLRYSPTDGQIYMDHIAVSVWLDLMRDEGVLPVIPENVIIGGTPWGYVLVPYQRNNPEHPNLSRNIKTVGFYECRSNNYLVPRYKHLIINQCGLSHDQFLELYGWKSSISMKEYRTLLMLYRKWRKRLYYREFKGKPKRGY